MKGKTRKGAMTTGKTKAQQEKELRRQMEMRKKFGGLAPMEPVEKKAGGGGLKQALGTVSPVYGMATGEGMFGESVGILPAMAKQARKRKDARAMREEMKQQQAQKMMKGGKVKYSVDGCAVKGKTRAKTK